MFLTFNSFEKTTGARYQRNGVITLNHNQVCSVRMTSAYIAKEEITLTILQIIMTNSVRHYVEPQDYDKFHEIFGE